MNRRVIILLALAVLSGGFALWQWCRPYEWGADPKAGATVSFSQIRSDHGFFWLDVHLKIRDDIEHDLRKPVMLILADGRELAPAEITLESNETRKIEALSLKFWLEGVDLDGPLRLRINDGILAIRGGSGRPELANQESRSHQTSRW